MISCKLKDVCKLVKGKQIDTTQLAENLPFKYINGGVKESGYYEKYNTNGNTIIISEGGASCGYVSYITEKFWLGCHCYKLIDVSVDSKYLFYALKANQQRIMELRTGAAMPNIKKTILNELQIKISMDEAEQKQAVKNLDYIEHLLEIENTALLSLDELTKSRFIEMFGDLKANPNGWTEKQFSEFAEIDGTMTTDYEKYADYPHIGIDSIEKGTGELKGYRTVREDGVISGKYIFTPEHIIYSKIRPNLNKVALPSFTGLCSADAYPILPHKDVCNRIYLATVMRSDFFLDYILQFSSRANMPKVNRKEISGFVMPMPPLGLQNEFATFVEQVDKSKLVIKKTIAELEKLKSSLMQKYFFD